MHVTSSNWFPALITSLGLLVLWLMTAFKKDRGAKSLAAKNYSEKVFSEMTALFDELKEKAKEAETRALAASTAAQDAQKRAQEAQQAVTDAHASVTAAQQSAAQAQAAATEAQKMVADGFGREGENHRQLTAAWEKIDGLTERMRLMENANNAMMGGALKLDPLNRTEGLSQGDGIDTAAMPTKRRQKTLAAPTVTINNTTNDTHEAKD
jgi:hypothetical protein